MGDCNKNRVLYVAINIEVTAAAAIRKPKQRARSPCIERMVISSARPDS